VRVNSAALHGPREGESRDQAVSTGGPPPSLRPRIGFAGIGWIGRNRLEAIAASGVAEIVGILDPSQDMIAAARDLAPVATQAGTLEELLDLDLEGVVIATPSALHAEQAITALERGVAVFCQKPLGRNAAETAAVVRAASSNDLLLAVDLSYRHVLAFQTLREVVRSGEIGRVFGVEVVFHNAYGPDKPWFYDPAQAGGGCVMDLGIHLVDMALWVLDFPRVEAVDSRLFAGGIPVRELDRVEDYATAHLDLAGGTSVQLACSWNLPAGRDAVISATFYGTTGGVAVHNVGGSFYDFVAERYRGTSREILAGPPDAWGGRAAVAWARDLAAGSGFDPEAECLISVAEVLDRIYGR